MTLHFADTGISKECGTSGGWLPKMKKGFQNWMPTRLNKQSGWIQLQNDSERTNMAIPGNTIYVQIRRIFSFLTFGFFSVTGITGLFPFPLSKFLRIPGIHRTFLTNATVTRNRTNESDVSWWTLLSLFIRNKNNKINTYNTWIQSKTLEKADQNSLCEKQINSKCMYLNNLCKLSTPSTAAIVLKTATALPSQRTTRPCLLPKCDWYSAF